MSNAEDLNKVEVSIQEARDYIKLHDVFKRLSGSKDFQTIIEELYFDDHLKRLVFLRSESGLPQDVKDNIISQLDAIAHFRSFLVEINQKGVAAKASLEADEATREEILAEGV